MVGKTCVAIANLLSRSVMGGDACGMLIAAVYHGESDEKRHPLMPALHIPADANLLNRR